MLRRSRRCSAFGYGRISLSCRALRATSLDGLGARRGCHHGLLERRGRRQAEGRPGARPIRPRHAERRVDGHHHGAVLPPRLRGVEQRRQIPAAGRREAAHRGRGGGGDVDGAAGGGLAPVCGEEGGDGHRDDATRRRARAGGKASGQESRGPATQGPLGRRADANEPRGRTAHPAPACPRLLKSAVAHSALT